MKKAWCYVLSCLLFLMGNVVSADEESPAGTSSDELTEIVVSAQRRSENLQSVPIAVTAITATQLADAEIKTTQDLAAVTPGLTFQKDFEYLLPHIRGVGNTAVAPGADNSVSLYVDGVYYASPTGSILSLNNTAQIEVVKGPQGTLFGRNSTGGLIQVFTKDPSQVGQIDAHVGYANYQTSSGDLYATGGVTSNLAADIAVEFTHQGEGWGRNLYNGADIYKLDRDLSARSKWLWTPADGTRVVLSFDFEDSGNSSALVEEPGTAASNPIYPASAIELSPYNGNENVQPSQVHRGGGASLHLVQELGFADLVDIIAYRRSIDYFAIDFDLGPGPYSSNFNHQFDEQVSEELQLRSSSSGPLTWTGGLYYFHARDGYEPLDTGFGGPAAPPAGPDLFLTEAIDNATQNADSLAGYAQATYAIVPSYNLTAGVRFTHEKRSFDVNESGVLNEVIPVPLLSNVASFSVNKPTWRIALDHEITDQVMGYVSYNRGFKSGGYNPGDPAGPAYQTEQLDAYEIGVKSETFGRRLRLNSAVFYYDYKNIQVSRFLNGVPSVYNGGAAQIYGFDVDLNAALSEHFEMDSGVEVLHDKFTDFPCADFFQGLATNGPGCPVSAIPGLPYLRSAQGNKLPDTPDASASVTLTYHHALWQGDGRFSVTDSYNSSYFFEPNNDANMRQPAFNLVNTTASWTSPDEHFSVHLWARNLTNKVYAIQLSSSPAGVGEAFAPPRTYGITLGTRF